MNTPSENDWKSWSKYVLMELKRQSDCCTELSKKLDSINVDLAKLKVKAGVWGTIGGATPVLILIALYFLGK